MLCDNEQRAKGKRIKNGCARSRLLDQPSRRFRMRMFAFVVGTFDVARPLAAQYSSMVILDPDCECTAALRDVVCDIE